MFDSILFVQLGSPASTSPADVERYLVDFLGDRHTLGCPPPFWKFLLRHWIAPRRAPKSAAKYKEMVELSGLGEMPLIAYTRRFAAGVSAALGAGTPVRYAFEFGSSPTIEESLRELAAQGSRRVRVVPLFPQRSLVTTVAVRDLVLEARKRVPDLDVDFIEGLAASGAWRNALLGSIRKVWNGEDSVLLSFHAVPQKWIDSGDPYRNDCEENFREIRKSLLETNPSADVRMAFQSRLGPVRWTEPATVSVLEDLAHSRRGVLVACPSFTVDNLETLYEMDVEMRQKFLEAGGIRYSRVPCPNDDPEWIRSLAAEIAEESFGVCP